MSVYLHKKSTDGVFTYDFQVGGERFSGSTGKTTRREAEQEEKRLKDEARAQRTADAKRLVKPGDRMSISDACVRYYEAKPGAAPKDLLRDLSRIADRLGPQTMIHEISDASIERLVAARRGDFIVGRKNTGDKLVSDPTVNRTVTLLLRRMLMHCRHVYKSDIQIIDWKRHMRREPQERVRELRPDEEAALMDQLDDGYDEAVRFAIRMGLRRMEIIALCWTDVDFFNNVIRVKGKGSRQRSIPLPFDMRAFLWSLKENHPVKVFTYVARCTRTVICRDPYDIVRGRRYPLTKFGLRKAFDIARDKAGVSNYRFHDNRHTAATRLLRSSKNLRVVQKLLGHSDITTTTKYAHSDLDDLARALNEAAPADNVIHLASRKPA